MAGASFSDLRFDEKQRLAKLIAELGDAVARNRQATIQFESERTDYESQLSRLREENEGAKGAAQGLRSRLEESLTLLRAYHSKMEESHNEQQSLRRQADELTQRLREAQATPIERTPSTDLLPIPNAARDSARTALADAEQFVSMRATVDDDSDIGLIAEASGDEADRLRRLIAIQAMKPTASGRQLGVAPTVTRHVPSPQRPAHRADPSPHASVRRTVASALAAVGETSLLPSHYSSPPRSHQSPVQHKLKGMHSSPSHRDRSHHSPSRGLSPVQQKLRDVHRSPSHRDRSHHSPSRELSPVQQKLRDVHRSPSHRDRSHHSPSRELSPVQQKLRDVHRSPSHHDRYAPSSTRQDLTSPQAALATSKRLEHLATMADALSQRIAESAQRARGIMSSHQSPPQPAPHVSPPKPQIARPTQDEMSILIQTVSEHKPAVSHRVDDDVLQGKAELYAITGQGSTEPTTPVREIKEPPKITRKTDLDEVDSLGWDSEPAPTPPKNPVTPTRRSIGAHGKPPWIPPPGLTRSPPPPFRRSPLVRRRGLRSSDEVLRASMEKEQASKDRPPRPPPQRPPPPSPPLPSQSPPRLPIKRSPVRAQNRSVVSRAVGGRASFDGPPALVTKASLSFDFESGLINDGLYDDSLFDIVAAMESETNDSFHPKMHSSWESSLPVDVRPKESWADAAVEPKMQSSWEKPPAPKRKERPPWVDVFPEPVEVASTVSQRSAPSSRGRRRGRGRGRRV